MTIRCYTIKTRLGTTVIPRAQSFVSAIIAAAIYHKVEPNDPNVFAAFWIEAFWIYAGQSGIIVKTGPPKPYGTDIIHIPPKPKKPRKASVAISVPKYGVCLGCGAPSSKNYRDQDGATRCSECERPLLT